VAEFEYHNAGNTEAQQKMGLSWLATQSAAGKAAAGVVAGLLVTQTGTASASVLIAAGAGFAQNANLDGASLMVCDTQKTLDILGANPMGATPRNDIVIFDSATTSIRNVVGTPNAVPSDPTVPGTSVALARLRHAASATTVPAAKIDDLRKFVTIGGLAAVANQTERDALYKQDGTAVYRRDKNTIEVYNGSTWDTFSPTAGAASGTATITPSAANTPTTITVNLPAGRFATAPAVVATPVTAVPGTTVLGVGVGSISTTSFDLTLTRSNTTATGICWVAISAP
jgi:hypothetical protein